MTEKVIPITDLRQKNAAPVSFGMLETPTGILQDQVLRPLRDLRISVTDRCNFRCVYCMPKHVFDKDYAYLPQTSLLTFEEITRLVQIFIAHGVEKIRLTGGEPLLRKNIEHLVSMLSSLKTVTGKDLDLTLTTNGSLLAQKAQLLKNAGLKRITVSLDALDDTTFKQMNDVDASVADILHGIEVAQQIGLSVKVNMVVKGSMNDHQILPMARHFQGSSVILRFIEYMDVGATNDWNMREVVSSEEVIRRIQAEMPLEPLPHNYPGETAQRWQYRDGTGEIGVISSVTQAFCGDCSRARLSTEGKVFTCLFATSGYDLRPWLRQGNSDQEISTAIAALWRQRSDRYSEVRSERRLQQTGSLKKIEMSYIGG